MPDLIPDDPLGVRAGARFVLSRSELVSTDVDAIEAFAATLVEHGPPQIPPWEPGYHHVGDRETTIAYLFVVDTVNFCFWGDPKWQIVWDGTRLDGYWALAATLTRAVDRDPSFLSAARLATIDAATLGAVLDGDPPIPLLDERAANLRELGRWIGDAFGGAFGAVLTAVDYDAVALARAVITALPSYRDVATYAGRLVPFYKRAQILAADLHGVLQSQGWGALRNMEALTAFADYKVPQILRHHGVLRYAPALAAPVDAKIPLPAGSREEVQIRAATIRVVEMIRTVLAGRGFAVPAYQIDWLLWLASQDSGAMLPYHRTRTIFY